MPHAVAAGESPETILCTSCGLCCTGHLFTWVRLNASELEPSEVLGLNVIRNDPRQRGFTQPCPLWQGVCTVYTSPHYPRGCRSYRCKLLKDVIDESIRLPDALEIIRQAMDLIRGVEALLPDSQHASFRERLVEHMEQGRADSAFRLKANVLLAFIETHFGVKDFFDNPAKDNKGR